MRNKNTLGLSAAVAALTAALLLSLLLNLMYSLWSYEKNRVVTSEGDYHARIDGQVSDQQLSLIRGWANVESAQRIHTDTGGAVEIRLADPGSIYEELPAIAALAGLDPGGIIYNDQLLSLYLVQNPRDPDGALLIALFGSITAFACAALVLVIHNAFAVSMNEQVRHLGILSSIGATPRQIRGFLLRQAARCCALPILAGNLLGLAAAAGLLEGLNLYVRDAVPNRMDSHLAFHPLVVTGALLCAAATVGFSAWLPARRLSKLTPLEAIRGSEGPAMRRGRGSHILGAIFGIEGTLAGNALLAQRKALRTATLSITLAFLAFVLMENVFSLSRLSTQITYWDRYQNAWDVIITVEDVSLDTFTETESLQAVPGVRNLLVYQKAEASCLVTEEQCSDAFAQAGGFAGALETEARKTTGGWLVSAPVVVMDDASFLAYCVEVGAPPRLDGVILYNEVRDPASNLRQRRYLPYLQETSPTTTLQTGISSVELPILAYAYQTPVFREQFGVDNPYELAHFMPVSLWEQIGWPGDFTDALTVRVLAKENATLQELDALENDITCQLVPYTVESENRIRAKLESDRAYDALAGIFSCFCLLLAGFGVSGIFLNALGFARQRRREAARCLSLGMTPAGLGKMFLLEALALAGCPVLVSLPLAAILTAFLLRAASIDPALFVQNIPAGPVLAFVAVLFGSVGLAYWLGTRRLLRQSLAELVRDEMLGSF